MPLDRSLTEVAQVLTQWLNETPGLNQYEMDIIRHLIRDANDAKTTGEWQKTAELYFTQFHQWFSSAILKARQGGVLREWPV